MGAAFKIGLTVVIVVLMLDGGLRRPVGRVFSWPMYAWAVATLVRIEVLDRSSGQRRSVNLYDDLPRGEFLIPPDLLDLYLDQLRQKYGPVTCTGHVYGPFGEAAVSVVDDHVAADQR